MKKGLKVAAERVQPILRRVDKAIGNACQTEALNIVVPKCQLILAAGAAKNVEVERLHVIHIDVADVLGRCQKERLDLLQRAPLLQETDPAGPAPGIRFPAKKAEVKLIDESAERFGRAQDGVGDGGLALGGE